MELTPVYREDEYVTKGHAQKKRVETKKKESGFSVCIKVIAWLNGLVVAVILLSLMKEATYTTVADVMTKDTISAIGISFVSIILSLGIVVVIGIPVAYILATQDKKRYRCLEGLICLPVILPPTVAGIALLMTFGKRGLVGQYFNLFGVTIPFSFAAVVIAQVFTISPYFIQIVKTEFETISKDIVEAAKVCGAGEATLVLKIFAPIARKGIVTGIIIGGLRGLGEFGATMMFAGNMIGKTQTLTLRIYSLYQLDVNQAVALAVIQLIIVIFFLGVLRLFSKKLEH